jgi:hypothetical protein
MTPDSAQTLDSAASSKAVPPELTLEEMLRDNARREWISRYIRERERLANGRKDHEGTRMEGSSLFHVVGHRLPEEVARQHFNSCTGADDSLLSAENKFQALAAEIGLAEGGRLSRAQLDFAHGVAELCAAVGDRFRDVREGSAGDRIRAMYGPVPF